VRRPRALSIVAVVALLLAGTATARAATITVINSDDPGEGFNEATPAFPVAGNDGTTVGQQRLNAFAAAAAYWADRLSSPVTVRVVARMNPLFCSPSSAILGQAGMTEVFSDFSGAPLSNTWYPFALANALHGADLDNGFEQIDATFNSALNGSAGCLAGNGWWYGIGAAPPGSQPSFYETVRHEIAHGLGFATVVNTATGARLQGMNDVYMTFLENHTTGKRWPQMSDAERAAAAKATGSLHWVGPEVIAASTSLGAGRNSVGHVQMYAPGALLPGSSVSHWDTALLPDELMEPRLNAAPTDVVTTALLRDIGWTASDETPPPPADCTRDAQTACLAKGRFVVTADYRTAKANGHGQVMAFSGQRAENDDSAFFWFFTPTNFEMGVKVLDACAINGKYWVYISGLTDQGWTVTVRDTRNDALKTYDNPVGALSTTFADSTAFSCD